MDSATAQFYSSPAAEFALAGTYTVLMLHHFPRPPIGGWRSIFIGLSFKYFNSNTWPVLGRTVQGSGNDCSPGYSGRRVVFVSIRAPLNLFFERCRNRHPCRLC